VAAEYKIKNLAYGVPVLSTITKGRIKFIDIKQAEKMPGVIGVMTSENCMMLHTPSGSDPGSGNCGEGFVATTKWTGCFTTASILQ